MTQYSPALGTLTAVFEFAASLWIFRFAIDKRFKFLVIGLLVLLGIYQILEVTICMQEVQPSQLLSRLAFLDITWLPPMGLLLIQNICPHTKWLKQFVRAVVIVAALMSFWILVDYRFVTGTICEFMYAKYTYIEPYFHFYGAFYEISQMSLIFLPPLLMAQDLTIYQREHLRDIQLGALLFVVPSIFLVAVVPGITGNGLPSVMCHFAIFLAVFLLRMAKRELTNSQLPTP